MVLVVLVLEPPGQNRPSPEPIFYIKPTHIFKKGSGPRFSRVGSKVFVGRNRETLNPNYNINILNSKA
ncbi:hypothetical protein Hanom_Chr10g00876661 [Helianthus anomalus]